MVRYSVARLLSASRSEACAGAPGAASSDRPGLPQGTVQQVAGLLVEKTLRQMVQAQDGLGSLHGVERIGQDVAQFPDVASPRMRAAYGKDVLVDADGMAAFRPQEAGDDGVGQQGDIGQALAQRRHDQVEEVEPVIKVFPELSLPDHLFEIAVGGGYQAEIHMAWRAAAQLLDLVFFQHAQQFCLEREGHLAYLVQKEGPAFRQFEQPFLARGPGPRERPAS